MDWHTTGIKPHCISRNVYWYFKASKYLWLHQCNTVRSVHYLHGYQRKVNFPTFLNHFVINIVNNLSKIHVNDILMGRYKNICFNSAFDTYKVAQKFAFIQRKQINNMSELTYQFGNSSLCSPFQFFKLFCHISLQIPAKVRKKCPQCNTLMDSSLDIRYT